MVFYKLLALFFIIFHSILVILHNSIRFTKTVPY